MFTSLELSGYRLLDEFQADFQQLTVVIGANASGKSTLIDALQLICDSMHYPMETALNVHGGMYSILSATDRYGQPDRDLRWRLSFRKPDPAFFWGRIPLEASVDYTFEVALGNAPDGRVTPNYETLRRRDPAPSYDEPFKYMESTAYRSMVFDRASRRLVPFDQILPSQTEQAGIGAVPGDTSTAPAVAEPTLRLSQMRFLNELPVLSNARLLLASMAFYPSFDIGRSSRLRTSPAEIRKQTVLFSSGENLGTVLHELLNTFDFRNSADELRSFLRAAYPAFEEITAETALGGPPRVLVRVREKGMKRSMDLWDLSDGMLRFLCLCAALLNPFPPSLIAIDEPEAGLHPKLLPIVGDLIHRASESTQVLITTHSPDLLNRFGLGEVAVMAREDTHVKWFRPASRKSLQQMLEQVSGETLGDLQRSGELEAHA